VPGPRPVRRAPWAGPAPVARPGSWRTRPSSSGRAGQSHLKSVHFYGSGAWAGSCQPSLTVPLRLYGRFGRLRAAIGVRSDHQSLPEALSGISVKGLKADFRTQRANLDAIALGRASPKLDNVHNCCISDEVRVTGRLLFGEASHGFYSPPPSADPADWSSLDPPDVPFHGVDFGAGAARVCRATRPTVFLSRAKA